MARKQALPVRLAFNCYVLEGDLRAFAHFFFDHLRQKEMGSVCRWSDDEREDGRAADFERALRELRSSSKATGSTAIEFSAETSMTGLVQLFPDHEGGPMIRAALQWAKGERDGVSDFLSFQRNCLSLCQEILNKFHVHSADLRPDAEGYCIPDVPLVDHNSHIVVTNVEEVEALYERPEAFWQAGFEVAAERDGQLLLARDMDLVGGPEYLKRIIGPQWAMARAARAGQTGYETPSLQSEEVKVFKAGRATLRSVGYDKKTRSLEYSCAIEPDEHINGWETYALLEIIDQGKTDEGWQVETVRVVFLDRGIAEAEKRPLLDIGCRVFHHDDDGELSEIEDDA